MPVIVPKRDAVRVRHVRVIIDGSGTDRRSPAFTPQIVVAGNWGVPRVLLNDHHDSVARAGDISCPIS